MTSIYHNPVLLHESIDALQIKKDGVYVDVTFGGGGHAQAILEKLGDKGRLFAFDQDEDAIKNIIKDKRLTLIRHNYRYLKNFLRYYDALPVDGILADLGISSYQINEAERGFSFPLLLQQEKRNPPTLPSSFVRIPFQPTLQHDFRKRRG